MLLGLGYKLVEVAFLGRMFLGPFQRTANAHYVVWFKCPQLAFRDSDHRRQNDSTIVALLHLQRFPGVMLADGYLSAATNVL